MIEIFLDKQSQLLALQAEHLNDEHAVRLHYLRGHAREVHLRRFGLRPRLASSFSSRSSLARQALAF